MGHHRKFNHTLALITTSLLEDEIDFRSLSQSTDQLFRLLMEVTEMSGIESGHRQPLLLPDGKGIGPYWAAMCVNDMLRTRKFVRGLYFAIKEAQKIFPDTCIHVLYAGTGPFATLALPMTCLFTPDQVQFTFLEANPITVDMLHKTIEAFGIQSFIKDTVLTDATTYRPTETVHILLTETMQRALDKEPQVAITQQLIPYLHPDGFLVPESIVVQAGLLNTADEKIRLADVTHPPEYYIRYLDIIFELNRHSAISYANEFPTVEIEVSRIDAGEYRELNLFTHIRVFGQEIITPWQSGLSLPKKIAQLDFEKQSHHKISFQYLPGARPGFSIHFLN